MKKVLFAINTLNNGGAEKVLLTLLRYLDPEKYEIHLLVVFGEGIYFEQIPKYVRVTHIFPCKSKEATKEIREHAAKLYEQYVKEKTPRHNLFLNMCKAFFLGGLICLLGQVIYHYFELRNLSPDECSRWMSLSLILLSVLFTGTGIYQKLAAWGGAGALVPITGFANSVAAPAIEYKKEGQVFGIGCKIFTIAGPVILYGIFTSWGLGLIYWFGTLFK